MLGQKDDKSLCLPPIWIVPSQASRVGMSSGSRYRTVVIPELQPDLSCSLRVKKHEGLLKPLLSCLWKQKEGENVSPLVGGELCSPHCMQRKVSVNTKLEARLRYLNHCFLWEMCVGRTRRHTQTPCWLGSLRRPVWNCQAHPRFSCSSRPFHPPLF